MEVNATLSPAAMALCACFISCEGVLNLRMAGTLAHALCPCCSGYRVSDHKMPTVGAWWAQSKYCLCDVTGRSGFVSDEHLLLSLSHGSSQRVSELELRARQTKIR